MKAFFAVAAFPLVALLASLPARADEGFERFTSFRVVGRVADFNEKYVLLTLGKRHRIVPRRSIGAEEELRPGKLVSAHLATRDIAETRPFARSLKLPR